MQSNFKYSVFRIACCLLLFFSFSTVCFSQSLGDAIVNITFGAGTNKYGGSLPAANGSTTYTYFDNSNNANNSRPIFPLDGEYSIMNTSAGINAV